MSAEIEVLAAKWLALERQSAGTRLLLAGTHAEAAAEAYDLAIRAASPEELLLAWQAAEKAREACLVGSVEWSEARSVAQLLRLEYQTATDR